MTIGRRIFVVAGDNDIQAVTQKSFDGFFMRGEPSLTSFAGSNIHITVVYYTIANRKPHQIIRMDNLQLTVKADGSMDQERMFDALRASMNLAVAGGITAIQPTQLTTVIDATAKFDEKRWNQFRPKLPGPAMKRILQVLFP
ncbi:hypothetical protein ACM79S_25825 [Pseudomonas aeruginosa]|uniref:hypothetical protein n=1 Tax=Pseudomonas aeruginosa TaxID=287 RepID=UPI002A6AFFB6|nr:hypothetical protein [Pseudomonas aeruginosa]MDY1247808.1 hypothetical protein [Pseudomonas aeruginosa]HCF9805952.1 hypothetical protein [Pseudomonas aeruginosa]